MSVELVGYGMEGSTYCVECAVKIYLHNTKCNCDKDENGLCAENCSGEGPNPIFNIDDCESHCDECGCLIE